MANEDLVKYWVDTAAQDFQTVEHLFASRDYHWGLFVGHLVLEKLFKALYGRKSGNAPPRIHDLARLAQKCGLELDEQMLDKREMISRFNLTVRYPDFQQQVHEICTEDFSLQMLTSIKEIRSWLLELIQTS